MTDHRAEGTPHAKAPPMLSAPAPLPTLPPEASTSGEDGLPIIARDLIGRVLVQLDGRQVYACVAYSTTQGFVRVLVGNGKGYLVQGVGDQAQVATFKAEGVVTVAHRPDARQGEAA